jgi:adenine-specific DNA-methyltransferase
MFCAASEVGRISCVMNPYKRYRVSAQRMSKKPMNVEFVLTIDTGRPSTSSEAMDLVHLLKATEEEANTQHSSNL